MKVIVSSFYKYVKIKAPVRFKEKNQEFCKISKLKGKVLIAKEGINGSISGTKEQISRYEKYLLKNDLFNDVKFKHSISDEHPFKKMIIRVKKEIVTSDLKVNLKKKGKYISPIELNNIIDNKEDVIILDARNNYESKIGKFKNAITPNIETFREFKKLKKSLLKYKDKKIITYCTGGVRCEKASAFLKEIGFKNVFQLEGGILDYINKFPDKYFEGRCFVFDSRMSIPVSKKSKEISICELCHMPCSSYINCSNQKCDKLFISCKECSKKLKKTCSYLCLRKINKKF